MLSPMSRRLTSRTLLLSALLLAAPAAAQNLPCKPCAGLRVADPAAVAGLLTAAKLPPKTTLFIAWEAPLDGSGDASPAAAVAAAGATPWVSLPFRTAAPLLAHEADLEKELEEASRLARQAPAGTVFQILWRPAGGEPAPGAAQAAVPSPAPTAAESTGAEAAPEAPAQAPTQAPAAAPAAASSEASAGPGAAAAAQYAYLVKRAGVAVSGASPGARVASRPLPTDEATLRALYGEEVAAYLDVVALAPATDDALHGAVDLLAQLDPGRPVVIDAPPLPAEPSLALAEAARLAALGAGATLFDAGAEPIDDARIAPFLLLAKEFAGDLSFDPYSSPNVEGAGAGTDQAWAFVRGADLGLRVIARTPAGADGAPVDELALTFSDPQLRDPERVDPASGETIPLAGIRRSSTGVEIRVSDPGPVAVLRLARPTAAELQAAAGVGGVAERVTVSSEREMPVEEILRRLQAFEDAQERRIDHYQATNTTHLRFGAGTAGQSFEASIEGDFFFRRGEDGSDWAWQTFYVNGVRWRGKSIPEFPLIQPEKAAALPLLITFDKTYRYRLRGTDTVDGRDCWVVDFAPSEEGAAAAHGKLFRGTVWVDRTVYARVRTRAVQLGLEGEVISNDETLTYTPIDARGAAAPWQADSFVLPLHVVSEQLLSIVNATTQVERETVLTNVVVNGPDFERKRAEVMASDVTMVRDTDHGLRYLVKEEGKQAKAGERKVQEGFDTTKLFLAGGVFYDDSLAYPLPLAGVNYFSFDFKGTGKQLNVFFAGALLTVNAAQPRLFGSRFDFGGDAFAIAIPLSDSQFRDNVEQKGEEIKSRPASASLKLGRPLGQFVKLGLEYRISRYDYRTTSNTDPTFVLPPTHYTNFLGLNARYSRSGYSLTASGTYARRSSWDFWGLPGNTDFSPDQKDYVKWDASLAKSWYLSHFQKIGAEVDYLDGHDLDRFSKYEFGFFGGSRIHGYQSNRVRAERAYATHLSYGFEIGELLRLDLVGDAAMATDKLAGLKNELLAGAGIAGTFIGPWQTIVNVDFGVPVAGPDNGFALYLVFLKLFH
jgi:hypothetical protein